MNKNSKRIDFDQENAAQQSHTGEDPVDINDFPYRKRIGGLKYAFRGIRLLFRYEHNAWIHSIFGICIVVAGFLFDISTTEWVAVMIVCGCVFAVEALNTAIERLADVVSPGYSDAIRSVKDISAGGVLCVAIMAVIVGIIIFLPKIMALLGYNLF
jgi:diacylglycerol kinase (ATP)